MDQAMQTLRGLVFGAAIALSAVAAAEEPEPKYCVEFCSCDQLWVERNEYFYEAGYCFQSPLGKAVFDPMYEMLDRPCSPEVPTFPGPTAQRIARIIAMEEANNCAAEREGWDPDALRAILNAG